MSCLTFQRPLERGSRHAKDVDPFFNFLFFVFLPFCHYDLDGEEESW